MFYLSRFLRILQIVVQEPGAAFKHFLPSTLTLILDHIYPCIAQVTPKKQNTAPRSLFLDDKGPCALKTFKVQFKVELT